MAGAELSNCRGIRKWEKAFCGNEMYIRKLIRKREFYIILCDNEAIKLHSQSLISINVNKNAINFNRTTLLYRFNYSVLFKGALFRTNDATFQFGYRWVVCADCSIIFIVLSLSFREVYARDAFEYYRGLTMVARLSFR